MREREGKTISMPAPETGRGDWGGKEGTLQERNASHEVPPKLISPVLIDLEFLQCPALSQWWNIFKFHKTDIPVKVYQIRWENSIETNQAQ